MPTFTLTQISGGSGLTPATYNQNIVQIQTAIRGLQAASSTNGTVTSVGLVAPNVFSVSNSPITTNGNITIALVSQTANKIFASPNGSSGTPTFRSIVLADLPTITPSKGGNGLTSLGTAYQVMRVNSGASANEYFTLTSANAKLTLTPSSGALTFAIVESELNMSNMIGTVAITNGGTGATTAQNAIKNLTQASGGTVGNYLTLDSGKNPVWTAFPSIDTNKIANNAVTYSKIQAVSAIKLVGNPTNASANASEIELGGNLAFSSTKLITRDSLINIVTANYSLLTTDGVIYADATGGNVRVLLPNVSSINIGDKFTVKRLNSGSNSVSVTVYNTGTDTIDGETTLPLAGQYHAMTVQYVGVVGGKNSWFTISTVG